MRIRPHIRLPHFPERHLSTSSIISINTNRIDSPPLSYLAQIPIHPPPSVTAPSKDTRTLPSSAPTPHQLRNHSIMPFPPARSGALQPCTEKESTPLLPPSTPRNPAASSSTPADSSNLDPFPRSPPASKDEYGANRGSGYGYEYRYQTFAPAAKPPIIVSRSASYTDKDERRRNSQPPPHRSSSMGLTPPTGLKGTANKDDVMIFTCFWLFGAIVVMQFGVVLTAANEYVFFHVHILI